MSFAEHRTVWGVTDRWTLKGFVELADGRLIAMATDYRRFHWVLCRFEPDTEDERPNRWRLVGSRADALVLGTSLAMVLEVILDGDELERLEVGRLNDVASGLQ